MDDRSSQYSQGHGFNMMSGPPQFVQPGVPMMQQQKVMMSQRHMVPQVPGNMMAGAGRGQMMFSGQQRGQPPGPGMYQMNMMGMRMPTSAPPPYSQAHKDSYQSRQNKGTTVSGSRGNASAGKTEEQLQKERYFQQQQAKLKQFGKSSRTGELDPNKLIDSMFSGSEPPKPRTIKKPAAQQPQEVSDTDNGFGEFLSSPPSAVSDFPSQSQQTDTTSSKPGHGAQAIHNVGGVSKPAKPEGEKKDLNKMMLDSCDLSAPQKARLFQKPSLKDIHVDHSHSSTAQHIQHTSHNARRWDKTEELSDLFIKEAVKDEQVMPPKPPEPVMKKGTSPTSKHPPKPPPWVTDEKLLPSVYKQVLEASLVDGCISTERLYPILMLSGLPKEVMGHIWTLCNKITPGQLATTELYQLLGLIALAQHNFQFESTDILSRCPQPPVPILSQGGSNQLPPQSGAATLPPVAQSPPLPTPGPQMPVSGPQMVVPGPQMSVPGPQMSAPGPQMSASGPQMPMPGPQTSMPVPQTSVLQNQTPTGIPHSSQSGVALNTPFSSSTMMNQGKSIAQPSLFPQGEQLPLATATSSPALLPVTQLPPAGMPQGMMGNVVTAEEDDFGDFADFQSAPSLAPPAKKDSFGALMTDVKGSSRTPISDENKYLYSVPTPNDKAVAASMRPDDMKESTLDSFFGSDDSSEGAISPDEEYFDGYKSADSKPSDSTSQFSTDQSEGEDFKNFENYLDEFQRKKEQLDKESPLHRPISKSTLLDCQTKSPSKLFTKTTPVQKIPMPPHSIAKVPGQKAAPGDDFEEFAGFQSAPVEKPTDANNQASADNTATGVDLMAADEDKYAALRSLDFSAPVVDSQQEKDNDTAQAIIMDDSAADENWADFQTAGVDLDQANEKAVQNVQDNKVADNKSSILQLYDTKSSTNWAPFDKQPQETKVDSDWSAFDSQTGVQTGTDPVTVSESLFADSGNKSDNQSGVSAFSAPTSGVSKPTSFTGDIDDDDDDEEFSDFQSSGGSAMFASNTDIVQVKKTGLATDEILGLFKVKDEPAPSIKSRDDDFVPFKGSNNSLSETVNKLHGIQSSSEAVPDVAKTKARKIPHLSEDDDFMKPPPLDDGLDDDHDDMGSYSRGYDFDDMMKPKPQEKKVYGLYGANQQFVVTGHKKGTKDNDDAKNVTIEITKDSDLDNDSDSISSKDNDVFRGKFTLGTELGEDSQSVSSLDFVVNKRVQNLKDGDSLSVSSNDFGGFDASSGGSQLPESKSVDSLDLRKDEGNGVENGGSAEGSDKEGKEDSPPRDMTADDSLGICEPAVTPGLPIVGDRYSSILHDVPGSDKHAYEWQRCLDNACRMIQDANNVFNSISSSAVCNEVMRSSQGSQYVQGIIEIYRVACRIMLSMQKSGIHGDRLGELLKMVDLAWNNLTAFLVGGSVMPEGKSLDFTHGVLSPDEPMSQMKACGVCLLDVEMRQKQSGLDNEVSKLTYGGRQYHSTCANFWINCVDSTLPALSLPELL